MDTLPHTSDSPDVAYEVKFIAENPAAGARPKLSDAERLNVAQWLREAKANLRDADAGVPEHCSKVIVHLCRLVQQLTGEGFMA